jgi:hypothetical protein
MTARPFSRRSRLVPSITKSYEKMVAGQKKIEALSNRAAKFEGFGEKIKQFIESPLAGAKSAVTSLLTAMGPFGGAIAAGVTVLTGIALAGFEAAKSLGEYGVRIRDVELRTSLTAKEVGQFGFAARAAGQDTTIFERRSAQGRCAGCRRQPTIPRRKARKHAPPCSGSASPWWTPTRAR